MAQSARWSGRVAPAPPRALSGAGEESSGESEGESGDARTALRLAALTSLMAGVRLRKPIFRSSWIVLFEERVPDRTGPSTPGASGSSLITLLRHDPAPRVRQAAAALAEALFEGPAQRSYLRVASTGRGTTSFVSLSEQLGRLVERLHAVFLQLALKNERNPRAAGAILRALSALSLGTPYGSLDAHLFATTAEALMEGLAAAIDRQLQSRQWRPQDVAAAFAAQSLVWHLEAGRRALLLGAVASRVEAFLGSIDAALEAPAQSRTAAHLVAGVRQLVCPDGVGGAHDRVATHVPGPEQGVLMRLTGAALHSQSSEIRTAGCDLMAALAEHLLAHSGAADVRPGAADDPWQCNDWLPDAARDAEPSVRAASVRCAGALLRAAWRAAPSLGSPAPLAMSHAEDALRRGTGDASPAVRTAVAQQLATLADAAIPPGQLSPVFWESSSAADARLSTVFIILEDSLAPPGSVAGPPSLEKESATLKRQWAACDAAGAWLLAAPDAPSEGQLSSLLVDAMERSGSTRTRAMAAEHLSRWVSKVKQDPTRVVSELGSRLDALIADVTAETEVCEPALTPADWQNVRRLKESLLHLKRLVVWEDLGGGGD
ncbi:hypothetical protein QBZ16_003732 [Prototheca wickerhamii]|uniref:DUF4042 domain-containing protein n=1 Tax=Prototheca wickerhamii TaxID=3111 RepID=A0AAD9MH22_PROWI|nr:hypothetical protein QBZ16_003732 [Prototheca wickerhamii]